MTVDCHDNPCGCDDQYGPCPDHGLTIIQRDGATLRTAFEVSELYVRDAVSLGVTLSPYGNDVLTRAGNAIDADTDPDGELVNELEGLVVQVDTDLATMDTPYTTYWDDGYRIVRVTGGYLAD